MRKNLPFAIGLGNGGQIGFLDGYTCRLHGFAVTIAPVSGAGLATVTISGLKVSPQSLVASGEGVLTFYLQPSDTDPVNLVVNFGEGCVESAIEGAGISTDVAGTGGPSLNSVFNAWGVLVPGCGG